MKKSLAGSLTEYVRVYDLPPEVLDTQLKLVSAKYGAVKRIIREKFPADLGLDMQTGVRGVNVEKQISSDSSSWIIKEICFILGTKTSVSIAIRKIIE